MSASAPRIFTSHRATSCSAGFTQKWQSPWAVGFETIENRILMSADPFGLAVLEVPAVHTLQTVVMAALEHSQHDVLERAASSPAHSTGAVTATALASLDAAQPMSEQTAANRAGLALGLSILSDLKESLRELTQAIDNAVESVRQFVLDAYRVTIAIESFQVRNASVLSSAWSVTSDGGLIAAVELPAAHGDLSTITVSASETRASESSGYIRDHVSTGPSGAQSSVSVALASAAPDHGKDAAATTSGFANRFEIAGDKYDYQTDAASPQRLDLATASVGEVTHHGSRKDADAITPPRAVAPDRIALARTTQTSAAISHARADGVRDAPQPSPASSEVRDIASIPRDFAATTPERSSERPAVHASVGPIPAVIEQEFDYPEPLQPTDWVTIASVQGVFDPARSAEARSPTSDTAGIGAVALMSVVGPLRKHLLAKRQPPAQKEPP